MKQVDFFEKARARGPSGAMMWTVAILASFYGYYKIAQGNEVLSKEKFYEREARITMVPFLQAEADLTYLSEKQKFLDKEAEIMKDVPGWEVGKSVYLTKRWVPENFFPLSKFHKK